MRLTQFHRLHAARGASHPLGRQPVLPPHHTCRTTSTVPAAAGAQASVSLVDLIEWPEGTRPKRGGVTKASLTRLKVAELKAELARLGANGSGTKDQLAEQLLQVITAAAAGAATEQTQPAAAPPPPTAVADSAVEQTVAVRSNGARRQRVSVQQAEGYEAPLPAASAAATVQPAHEQQHEDEKQQSLDSDNVDSNEQETPDGSSSSSRRLRRLRHAETPLELVEYLEQQPIGAPVHPGEIPPLDLQEASRVAAAVGVQLEDLPPLVERCRGHVYDVAAMTELTENEQELVLKAVRSGLALTLLGGAVGDSTAGEGAPPCLGLLREKDIWLFDVGEDVQRSLLYREHMRASKMHRIVITRQTPDAMLGLPGMLCVIGASREKGHETADIPVHVFGPEGTGDYLSTLYECSNTFLEMPVVVHEFVMRAVPEEQHSPQILNKRAKLWRCLLPPDQLNPQGYADGNLELFMPTQGRAKLKKGLRAAGGVLAKNVRAGHRPMPTPPPGDPDRTDLSPSEMTWTIVADEAAMMTAVLVEDDPLSWGVTWREANRQGNLSVPRCLALKVTNEDLYRKAKNGEAVPNDDGVMIPANMLCSQDKPGRKIVLLPACSSAENLGRFAAGADVMFADAAAAAEDVQRTMGGISSSNSSRVGVGAAMCAQRWGVRHLVVTGIPNSSSNSSSKGRRSSSSSSSSSSSVSPSGGSLQQQQKWPPPLDPAVAAALSVVSEQYTCGKIIPAYDNMSLMVEESLGDMEPPPLDMSEKTELARATCLKTETLLQMQQGQEKQQQRKERQQQAQQQQQQQQQQRQQGWQQNGFRGQRQQQHRQWQNGNGDGNGYQRPQPDEERSYQQPGRQRYQGQDRQGQGQDRQQQGQRQQQQGFRQQQGSRQQQQYPQRSQDDQSWQQQDRQQGERSSKRWQGGAGQGRSKQASRQASS